MCTDYVTVGDVRSVLYEAGDCGSQEVPGLQGDKGRGMLLPDLFFMFFCVFNEQVEVIRNHFNQFFASIGHDDGEFF